jgi:hypothetical protein
MRFINIVTDHDTSEFAANSIKGWWRYHGIKLFSDPGYLLITPDCGGLKDIVIDFGNLNYRNCQIILALASRFVIFLQKPVNGISQSTVYFHLYRRIGEANH